MKNLKPQLAVLLLSTLCLFTGAYGQIRPSVDAATLNQGHPSGAPNPGFTAHAGHGKPFNRLNRPPYAWPKTGNTDRAVVATSAAQSQDQEIVLQSFGGSSTPNGAGPDSGLFRDADGNLYGTTIGGGTSGAGVVYKVNAFGKETALYSFTGGADGTYPAAGVIRDPAGNLYGTTTWGGNLLGCTLFGLPGCGVVFKVDTTGEETVLYTFTGGADGRGPFAGVIRDAAGNLYGTTAYGGAAGAGVVFKLAPPAQPGAAWTETVLYSFTGGADGSNPVAGVIRDSAGNLYGTTTGGGASGAGVVFKLDTAGQETVLYTFAGGADGGYPNGLIRDAAGNLYGTTAEGGDLSECYGYGCGVVFKLNPSGQETVLYTFTGGADGSGPNAVIRDAVGNLYGTTNGGGTASCGVVFKVDTTDQEKVLYTFTGGTDGCNTVAGVIGDAAGNLYGTTFNGGPGGNSGNGVVFKVNTVSQYSAVYTFPLPPDGVHPEAGVIRDAAGNLYGTASSGGAGNAGVVYKVHITGRGTRGQETVLYAFTGGADGSDPQAGLIADAVGNLYGTTAYGGSASGNSGFGVVFKLAPPAQLGGAWTETVLYTFTGGADGANPIAGVILDAAGNLYGTTEGGGASGDGVVFKLDVAGQETVLYAFTGGADGAYPYAGVIRDAAGNLYGTTYGGGNLLGCTSFGFPAGCGVVFKVGTTGQETVLYTFTGGADGAIPIGGLIFDSAGSLYGTTWSGGPPSGDYPGVVYKIDSSGNFSVLYAFTGFSDGNGSASTLIFDSEGNLYGTTQYGGQGPCNYFGCGVVFELNPAGQQTVLYSFTLADGGEPVAGVIRDAAGHLYGTTLYGGTSDGGVLFMLAPVAPSVSPTSLNFGNVGLGYRAKKVVTLENQGIDSVEIGPITFSATTGDASQFTDHSFCPSNLGAGKSCTIAVLFNPDAVGADAATLNIVTSAPGSPIQIPIAAAGKQE